MTSRLRPTTRRRPRFSLGDEDRQTLLVNAGFVAVIAIVVAILIGAAAWAYYDANIRALANVGGVEIRPDAARDRNALLLLRLDREERRVVQARAEDEITSSTAAVKLNEISTQREELQFTSLESLVDIIFQSQLAAQMGITVTPDDVAQREARELQGVERRHVQVIAVEPELSEGAVGPTFGQQRAALERAEQARAALEAGRPFSEVATEFNRDEDLPNNGDLGFITRANGLDRALLERLFELPVGEVSQVIRGEDGTYRVGQVVETRVDGTDPGFQAEIEQRMSLDRYRQFLEWEIAADRLRQRITDETMNGTFEQLRVSHIRIDNVSPDDEIGGEDEDQVHYSEILYAPADDPVTAPDLDEDDPAWEAARTEAEAALAELRAIEDETARLDRFREIAREDSDNEGTGAEGGDAGAVTADIPPSDVSDVLFEQQHEPETLLDAVRAENGYYLLWFHERQDPPSQRLAQLREALDGQTVDWPALVSEYSDDAQSRDEGGVIGWWTRDMLNQIKEELGDDLFALELGGISEPVGLGTSTHIFRVEERAERGIDPDQARFIRSSHFENWYSERKDQAEDDGVIRRADDEEGDPGTDLGEDFDDDLDDLGEGIDEEPVDAP